MKIRTKNIFINKYLIGSFFMLFIICFLSWLTFSPSFHIYFLWTPSPEYPTRQSMIDFLLNFPGYIREGYALIQLIAPILPILAVMNFFNDKKIFVNLYGRIKNYRAFMVKTIIKYVTVASVVMYLSYILFMLVGMLLTPMNLENDTQSIFADILGVNFYTDHPVIFYLILGFLRFFIFSAVYSLFAISISFLTDKKYLCILIPVAYFVVLSIIVSALSVVANFDLFFLAPTYTLMATSRVDPNTFSLFLPLLPPLIFSIFVIIRGTKSNEKLFA